MVSIATFHAKFPCSGLRSSYFTSIPTVRPCDIVDKVSLVSQILYAENGRKKFIIFVNIQHSALCLHTLNCEKIFRMNFNFNILVLYNLSHNVDFLPHILPFFWHILLLMTGSSSYKFINLINSKKFFIFENYCYFEQRIKTRKVHISFRVSVFVDLEKAWCMNRTNCLHFGGYSVKKTWTWIQSIKYLPYENY